MGVVGVNRDAGCEDVELRCGFEETQDMVEAEG